MNTEIKEYTKTEAALADLRSRYDGIVWQVATTKGMDEAKKARAEVRGYRTDLEKLRQEIKAPALERCRLIDDEAKRITAELRSIEDPIDAVIKAEEERKAAEKAERERIEAERVAAIRAKIAVIVGLPSKHVMTVSEELLAVIDTLEEPTLDEFAEFTGEALQAFAATYEQMQQLAFSAAKREFEAARLEAERKALAEAQAKAESEAAEQRRIEAEKLAAERAELDRQRREQEAAAAAAKAEQDRMQAEFRAEIERKRAEHEAVLAKEREDQQRIAAKLRAEIERQESERRQAEEAQRRQQEELARAKADAERKAREAEEARQSQERANHEATKPSRPTDDQIIEVLASHFGVHEVAVIVWLRAMDLESAANKAMEYAA